MNKPVEPTALVNAAPVMRAFVKDLAPAYIDHACIVAGFAPPPGSPIGEGVGAGFTYCELQCGSGLTPTLLAASNPLGDFHAIDARGSLLETGRAFAETGKIRNISFHEAGIGAATELDLPPLDYIIVSGIYSWVPLRERGAILNFVRKFLKPGGAVYVNYNARPGWNKLDAFRRVFREATRGVRTETKQRIDTARDLYRMLLEFKAPAIVASGITAAQLVELDKTPLDTLATDYANDFAEPLYVTEVASDFSVIDCHLVGAVDLVDSAAVLINQEPYKSVLERMPTIAGRELAKDFMRDTRHRRDVFVKGGRRLAADNREAMMSGLAFALEQPAAAVKYSVRVPFAEVKFDTEGSRAMVATLAQAPRSISELISLAHAKGIEAQETVGTVHALLVTGQIRPVYRASREAVESSRRMQSAIVARAGTPQAMAFLPSPFGTAFVVPQPDQLMMLSSAKGAEAMANDAFEKMSAGGKLADPEGTRNMITKRARTWRRSVEYYAALGVLVTKS
jgi:hypothetical protein